VQSCADEADDEERDDGLANNTPHDFDTPNVLSAKAPASESGR